MTNGLHDDYSEQEINTMLYSLLDDTLFVKDMHGEDFGNSQLMDKWKQGSRINIYENLLLKMRKLLEQNIATPSMILANPDIKEKDHTQQLLQLLREGKNNQELCNILNISPQQLYQELLKLKNNGLHYSRKYYSDGSIKYNCISTIQSLKMSNNLRQDKTIITDVDENDMKILLISDLHFGNELERVDLINRAYNYCAKNGINIILCGGDLIDGSYSKGTQKISDLYQQIEYFIANYPCDKNILTFSVAGDHDKSALNAASLNIIDACNNYRHDIIIGGYNNTGIILKNDKIHLYHRIENGSMRQTNAPIILHGHSHKYLTEIRNNKLNITIPSLSNIAQSMPSALELTINFNKGYISNAIVKHLYFGEQDTILSESAFDLSKERIINYDSIKNIESFKKQDSLTLTRVPSQIKKFYKRYGEDIYSKMLKDSLKV